MWRLGGALAASLRAGVELDEGGATLFLASVLLALVVVLALVMQPGSLAGGRWQRAPSQSLTPLTKTSGFGAATGSASVPKARERRVERAYGRLPLSFIPNDGQTDQRVRYYARGAGFSFYFTQSGAVLSFAEGKRGVALGLRFPGANPNVRLEARGQREGKVNYLTGTKAHTKIPTYRKIVYRELWPGIDLVFRGEGGRLRYEFLVRPGASPSAIRLAYRGAKGLRLGGPGALSLNTPLGTLR